MSDSIHHLLENDKRDSLDVQAEFPIDKNVIAKFPEGSRILSAQKSGFSEWTITGRLVVQLPDGTQSQHFLKIAAGDHGRTMMQGEYHAMTELYKWMPQMVPKPLAWGKYYVEDPETYFLLSEFIQMESCLPDADQLCAKLALLHKTSSSPDGRFGFHVTTCQGRTPQCVGWEASWITFFTNLLKHVAKLDFEVNGHWEELAVLEERMYLEVIPRLLGALEQDGRTIQPCLIHADLWEGNTGTKADGSIYIFDSGAFYAHNEMEVGDWRCHYNNICHPAYRHTYSQHMPASEPVEEFDDRNRLYCIYYNILYSVNHREQGTAVRQTAYNDMHYLIKTYAPFPDDGGPRLIERSEFVEMSSDRDHTMDM